MRGSRQRRGAHFTRAYALGLAERLPLLYLVMVFNIALLAVRLYGSAPLWLVLGSVPLGAYGLNRAAHWRPAAVARRSVEQQRLDLDAMATRASLSGLLFVCWTLSLYRWANADQRVLIQFILAVTMFTGILGRGQAPRSALALAIAYSIPASLFFAWVRHPDWPYIVLVQLGVTAMLLVATQSLHRDFVRLELSRQKLARREARAAHRAHQHYLQAMIDQLTGGLNRRGILSQLQRVLESGNGPRPWLMLVDLDGFKHVNDTYGHAAGDSVLCAVAQRIGEARGVIAHGRLGGDEFAILLDEKLDARAMLAACRRLSNAIHQPVFHNGATLRLWASIGAYRIGGDSVGACLERADAALYKAKLIGDGAACLFGADDERALQQRIITMRQFNDCPLDDRLRLLYQPIVDQRSGRTNGLEAFARWSPDGVNWQAPGEFMAIAEATQRTGELTRLVIARALAECPPAVTGLDLSINLSPRDLLREGAPDTIADVVLATGANPSQIILEVTEQALLADPRRTAEQLARFRDHGFRIALDNFGARLSSLSHLRELPLDVVKLDAAIAPAIVDDPSARAVAGMIVALAWQLGIECMLEGVENPAQAEAARALGLHLMQGYHFGRPEIATTALAAVRAAA